MCVCVHTPGTHKLIHMKRVVADSDIGLTQIMYLTLMLLDGREYGIESFIFKDLLLLDNCLFFVVGLPLEWICVCLRYSGCVHH